MRKILLFIIFLISYTLFSLPATDFDEANLFYEKGEYQNAVQSYEKIIAGGYENGEIYYNLGNSYYKLGDIALSIVNYERALKFLPKDADLIENLKIARLSLVDKIEEPTEVPFFTLYSDTKNSFNIYTAQKRFFITMIILGLIFSIYIILKNTAAGKLVLLPLYAILIIFMTVSYIYYDISIENSRRFGVVASDKISVLSSPDENINSKELFFLHKGTKAEILRSNEQWFEISLDEEKKGWIKKDSVIEI